MPNFIYLLYLDKLAVGLKSDTTENEGGIIIKQPEISNKASFFGVNFTNADIIINTSYSVKRGWGVGFRSQLVWHLDKIIFVEEGQGWIDTFITSVHGILFMEENLLGCFLASESISKNPKDLQIR